MYYYVSTPETIPSALPTVWGGSFRCRAECCAHSHPCRWRRHCPPRAGPTYVHAADGSIELGDLYAQDEKDVLVELELPALPTGRSSRAACLSARLPHRALSPRPCGRNLRSSVQRSPRRSAINIAIQVHLLRIEAAENIETASSLADKAISKLVVSSSYRLAAASSRPPCGLHSVSRCQLRAALSSSTVTEGATLQPARRQARCHTCRMPSNGKSPNEGVYSGAKHKLR